ncbi:hypothetical protein LJR027_001829 [Terrabacter sp. LjRoot27]|uniref:hypothetical protein n=1 Tax=Terrabacter sp. LjRoot27 TaxID=3342306 RepID=UPI003ED16A8F
MRRQPAERTRDRREPATLEDGHLRDEIELLLDVIVTASEHPRHLSQQEVDAALHLPTSSVARPSARQRVG